MPKSNRIEVKGQLITIVKMEQEDFISLTDIARFKDAEHTDAIIQNWMRNRNTVELLGLWETIHNPDFKPLEFEGFRKQAGLNSFVLTPKRWIETTQAVGIVSRAGRYAEHLLIKISPLNLLHGFRSNSNFMLSKNFSDSRTKKTIV